MNADKTEVWKLKWLIAAHTQVGEELSFMHGSYMFNRFDFYDYGAGHNHVHAISTIEFESLVNDW